MGNILQQIRLTGPFFPQSGCRQLLVVVMLPAAGVSHDLQRTTSGKTGPVPEALHERQPKTGVEEGGGICIHEKKKEREKGGGGR